MARGPPLLVLVPHEHREIGHPERPVLVALGETELLGQSGAQDAEHLVGDRAVVRDHQDEVAGPRFERRAHRGLLLLREELRDRRSHLTVTGERDPRESLGPRLHRRLIERVHPRARPVAGALRTDALDDAATLQDPGEDLERRVREGLAQVGELHAVAEVRAVGSEALHGFRVGHAREGQIEGHARLGHHLVHHLLDEREDVLLLDEGHLDVDLGELGLTVGTQVLVAETARDLVVAFDAAHHEQLLEQLRTLRQRVEVPGLHPARHEEVTRALGGRLAQDGRLHLEEPALLQRLAEALCDAVTQRERREHLGAADVHVAVLESRGLVGLDTGLHLERRRHRPAEHLGLVHEHLDLAGRQVLVHRAVRTMPHHALEFHDPFRADLLGGHEGRSRLVRVEDALHETGPVAQVDEDQPAVITAAVHPTGERDPLPHVLVARLAAHLRTHRILGVQRVHPFPLPIGRPASSSGFLVRLPRDRAASARDSGLHA